MRQYLDLLKYVLKEGTLKKNRTGVDTISTFGYHLRFDLNNGFPLITTRKINWKNIVLENLFFLGGKTDNKWLEKHGCKIWSSWADENGSLGPIYGYQWRNWQETKLVNLKNSKQSIVKLNNERVCGVGINDIGMETEDSWLYSTWSSMLDRCYNKQSKDYKDYGNKGIFVDRSWFVFSKFIEDVKKLENWYNKKEFKKKYSLDKDFYANNKYSLDTCKWSSSKEQSLNRSETKCIRVFYPNGKTAYFSSMSEAARVLCLEPSSISRQANGEIDQYKGYKFEIINSQNCLARTSITDQFENIICGLKNDPNNRRLVMSAWNVKQLDIMALLPCHCFTVFNVQYDIDGKPNLCLHNTIRSADTPIGTPHNVGGYAFILSLVSHLVGIPTGQLCIDLCDTHIYIDQKNGVKEQLTRMPKKLPQLKISKAIRNLTDLDILIKDGTTDEIMDCFKLIDYNPHPFIKFPVAV